MKGVSFMKRTETYKSICELVLVIFLFLFICLKIENKQGFDFGDLKVMMRNDFMKISPKLSDKYGPIDEKTYMKSLFAKNDDYGNNYYVMQALYRKALEEYLYQELNLGDLDQKVKDSAKDVGIKKAKIELYRKYGYMQTDYIYFRNIVHIERLSDSDLRLLYDKVENKEYDVDEKLMQLVEDTFAIVIPFRDDVKDSKKLIGETCYSSPPPYAEVNNNSLVLIMAYEIEDSKKYMEKFESLKTDLLDRLKWDKSVEIELVNLDFIYGEDLF